VVLVAQEFKVADIKITEEVENVTKIISGEIFDMRQQFEEGDILVGLLMSTIFFQHQLRMPFEQLQEMLIGLRLSVDEVQGIEKEEKQVVD
jgi:uncharacterized protein YfdQ (DUF2303 family)